MYSELLKISVNKPQIEQDKCYVTFINQLIGKDVSEDRVCVVIVKHFCFEFQRSRVRFSIRKPVMHRSTSVQSQDNSIN
jgi:hypothetical protein